MARISAKDKERIKKLGTLTISYADGSNATAMHDLGLILDVESIDEALPEQKRSNVSIPGRNGVLDTTYALTDAPLFDNRTLTYVLKAYAQYVDISELKNKLVNAFHGREVRVTRSWDPGYYFTGNCQVEYKYSSAVCIEITIKIDADPFMYETAETSTTITVSGTKMQKLANGTKWITPKVATNANLIVTINGKETTLSANTNQKYENIYLKSGDNSVKVSGTGNVTFTYRKGKL